MSMLENLVSWLWKKPERETTVADIINQVSALDKRGENMMLTPKAIAQLRTDCMFGAHYCKEHKTHVATHILVGKRTWDMLKDDADFKQILDPTYAFADLDQGHLGTLFGMSVIGAHTMSPEQYAKTNVVHPLCIAVVAVEGGRVVSVAARTVSL